MNSQFEETFFMMQKMFNTSNTASAWIIFYHFMLPMWKVSQYYGKHSSANGCTVQLYAEHNYNTTSGVIMYGNFEGFPINSALFRLVM